MKITLKREQADQEQYDQVFETRKGTVLEALDHIKEDQDATLTYRSSCRSGVCGSCAVRVNGVEKLACKCTVKCNDIIEPIANSKVIKDLVVNLDHEEKFLKKSHTFIEKYRQSVVTKKDEALIDVQSNCILCQSCYSSCPVYSLNESFLGPYALTRVLRYLNDNKEQEQANKIELIQQNGIWDCTLCGNCTMVCPQFIDPKSDIMNLRAKSLQAGYSDPNMMSFDQNEFNSGFDPTGGFNPSGGFDDGFNPNGF